MNIGEAAKQSGVSAKQIRYYESIGLLPTRKRTEGGYREFDDVALNELRFVRLSRQVGLPVQQISSMLRLWHDRSLTNVQVRKSANQYVRDLNKKIENLTELRELILSPYNSSELEKLKPRRRVLR